jgi:hypothetical protein
MAYVPGYSHDVFLSYARGDDPAWLDNFESALCAAVRGRLGHEIYAWRDIERLRVGQDWQKEIAKAIASTAVFLAILSPSYQASAWCSREVRSFLGPNNSLDSAKAGDLYRLLKVVKIPWENNDHEAFFSPLQDVKFFRAVEGPQEYVEFPLGGDAFMTRIQEIAAVVKTLLRNMRRSLEKVYVASPADDVLEAWERLRAQLRDDRYDVRPDNRLSSAYDDEVIRRDLENAKLVVHLLGPTYDEFAERQLTVAADAGRSRLIWFSKGTDSQDLVEPKQWKLLETIRKRDEFTSGLDWFPGGVQEMIGQVQNALRVKQADATMPTNGAARIYLIHDPTTREDAKFAEELKVELREKERFEVLFPPSRLPSMSDYHERHRQQLQTCEGVLLYWNAAPETWLDQYIPDVLYQGRKTRVRSKAFLLGDPSQLAPQPVLVIRRSPNFRLTDLEPFLKPLRTGGVIHANL